MRRVLDASHKEPEPADYNEASPDYALGQYKCIMKLVEALSKGDAASTSTSTSASTASASAASAPSADTKDAKTAAESGAAPTWAAGAGAAVAASAGAAAAATTSAHKENGEIVKAEVDDAMDKCKAMQHLRVCIVEARDKYNKETPERKQRSVHRLWTQPAYSFGVSMFWRLVFGVSQNSSRVPCSP